MYTRFRTRGTLNPVDVTYVGGGLNPYSQTYSGRMADVAKLGERSWFNDVVTPRWERKREAGTLVNNPMFSVTVTSNPYIASQHREKVTTPNAAWEDDTGALVSAVFGSLVTGSENDWNKYTMDSTEVERTARAATINTWKNVQSSSSQTLVTVAESSKTWETLYLRTKQLAGVVTATRRGDVKKLRELLPGVKPTKNLPSRVVLWDDNGRPILNRKGRPVAKYFHKSMVPTKGHPMNKAEKLWLEYRYGWCPIIYDIVDTLKAINAEEERLTKKPRPFKTAHGTATATQTKSTLLTSMLGGIKSDGIRQEDHELTVRGYILYRDEVTRLFERLNDFGLFDVPRAIWELVPLSFVVDWFVPVGDWLGALQPKVGVEILAMGHTTHHQVIVQQWCTKFWSNTTDLAWPPFAPIGARDRATIDFKDRKTSLGSPSFPPFRPSLGWKRMLDAAALMKGMR